MHKLYFNTAYFLRITENRKFRFNFVQSEKLLEFKEHIYIKLVHKKR